MFLAEAFTRPKVMHRLAKLGFTQSYTYFTWRNTKQRTHRVLHRADAGPGPASTSAPMSGPTRPTSCTNICSGGGRAGVHDAPGAGRDALGAATASTARRSSCWSTRRATPGSEEYLDSEKYQLRHWDLEQPRQPARSSSRASTRSVASNPALQRQRAACGSTASTTSSSSPTSSATRGRPDDVIVTVVNLDPHHAQSGWVGLDLDSLGLEPGQPFRCTTC